MSTAKETKTRSVDSARTKASAPIRGFTLIEVLVVIGIIALIAMIAFPITQKVREQAKTSTSQMTVNSIDQAINMYHSTHEVFPGQWDLNGNSTIDSNETWNASLVQCLTGYSNNDGKTGYGYRKVARGKVYGPWYGTEEIATDGTPPVFVDSFDNAIWYFRYDAATPAFTGDTGDWAGEDGASDIGSVLRYATKTYDSSSGTRVLFRRDYIVITPGSDNTWEAPVVDTSAGTESNTDDITNFKSK